MRKIFVSLSAILLFAGVAWGLTIDLPRTQGGVPVQNQLYPYSSQSVSFGNAVSTTNSTALVGQVVRLYATQNCFIKFGNGTQTASSSDCYLPSGVVETFTTKGVNTIGVVGDTATGTLYITDMY